MIGHVLVPLDGSKLAEGVLPYVEDLGRRLRARITFVQVVESGVSMFIPESSTIEVIKTAEERTERERKAASEYLSRLAGAWQAEGIETRWQAVAADRIPGSTPASKIIEVAHSLKADMIAMSTHGRSGLGRLFFGSVADEVLRESGIPVLLVRTGGREAKKPAGADDREAAQETTEAA
jgi:nucleotide-binding universal stress UspA family protein